MRWHSKLLHVFQKQMMIWKFWISYPHHHFSKRTLCFQWLARSHMSQTSPCKVKLWIEKPWSGIHNIRVRTLTTHLWRNQHLKNRKKCPPTMWRSKCQEIKLKLLLYLISKVQPSPVLNSSWEGNPILINTSRNKPLRELLISRSLILKIENH